MNVVEGVREPFKVSWKDCVVRAIEPLLRKTMKPATLLEVARQAGVSTATVARVLKSNGYVAEKTRKLNSAD
jgi:hypothetical protein